MLPIAWRPGGPSKATRSIEMNHSTGTDRQYRANIDCLRLKTRRWFALRAAARVNSQVSFFLAEQLLHRCTVLQYYILYLLIFLMQPQRKSSQGFPVYGVFVFGDDGAVRARAISMHRLGYRWKRLELRGPPTMPASLPKFSDL